MLQTVDLICLLVDKLRETSTISNVSKVGLIHTFTTNDLKSLVAKDELIFEEISLTQLFVIKSINIAAKTFTIETATDLKAVTKWKSASPYYLYGTPIQVNNEFLLKDKPGGLFIFLFEIINQKIDNDFNSSIDYNVNLDMYFMRYSNATDWTSKEHYRNVIDKTQQFVFDFIDILNDDYRVDRPENIQNPMFPDWGKFLKDRGFTDRILDQQFSGSGLNFNLPIYKTKCI